MAKLVPVDFDPFQGAQKPAAADPNLVPVDFDPFAQQASGPQLVPVDHNPFAGTISKTPVLTPNVDVSKYAKHGLQAATEPGTPAAPVPSKANADEAPAKAADAWTEYLVKKRNPTPVPSDPENKATVLPPKRNPTSKEEKEGAIAGITEPFNEMVHGFATTVDSVMQAPFKAMADKDQKFYGLSDLTQQFVDPQAGQKVSKSSPGVQFVSSLMGGLLPYAATYGAAGAAGFELPMQTIFQRIGSNLLAMGGADAMRAVGTDGGLAGANEAIVKAVPAAVMFSIAQGVPGGKIPQSIATGGAFAGNAAVQGENRPKELAKNFLTGLTLHYLSGGKPEPKEIEAYTKGFKEGKGASDDQMVKIHEIIADMERAAPEYPAPESKQTINAQARALDDPRSTKDTMIVTPGSPMPDKMPKGTEKVVINKFTPQDIETINPQDALEAYNNDEVPEGWYVHGRMSRNDLKTGYVIQLSKKWDIADQYSGLNGSKWMIAPKQNSKVLDMRQEYVRSTIVDEFKKDSKEQSFKDKYPELDEMINQGKEYYGEEFWEKFEDELNPQNIVNSAEAFDDPNFTQWLKSKRVDFVITEDGAVVLNIDKSRNVMLPKEPSKETTKKDNKINEEAKTKLNGFTEKAVLNGTYEYLGSEPQSPAPSVPESLARVKSESKRDAIAEGVSAVEAERERMDGMARGEGPYDQPTEFHSGGPNTGPAVRAVIEDTTNLLKEAPGQIKGAWDSIKEISGKVWNWYKGPTEFTEFKGILGEYLGTKQVSGYENSLILKKIEKAIPDKVAREGITNWIQAGGDKGILQERAAASKGSLKRGYDASLKLTPAEEKLAQGIMATYADYFEQAKEWGVLESGLENYVNQLWKREGQNKKAWKGVRSEINAGMLNTNFQYAKKRIFDSYFSGEQAGYTPANKDIAYLFGHYHQSMFEAISARKAIKSMFEGKASDGQPLVSVAGGRVIPKEPDGPHMLRPNAMYAESASGERYKPIDHPALRKWKWVDKDEAGNPIFMQGDVYVHPEAYTHLKNVLSRSTISDNVVGRGALALSRDFKSLLLSGTPSPFHQVNLGIHAVFHKINPMDCPALDFKDPLQRQLVKHGLMVYNYNALAEFADGIGTAKRSLAQKIPGVGPLAQAYSEYLFQDLIPRFKMKLGREAYARNLERYEGKYTNDQILELTANQANAAFGELNYKYMGRNPTMQDVFRLIALAPDFLEARARFVGQALKPGGREQAAALIRGTLGMYAAGVVGNLLFSDDHKPHWDKPFTLVINGKDYSLRSIPGDIVHLFKDPRSFVYHRLNPAITKPLVEFVTGGRDQWGRKRDIWQQGVDYLKGPVPILLQGMVNKREQTIWDAALQSIGVTTYQHKSASDQIIADYFDSEARLNQTPEERQKAEERRGLVKMGKDKNSDFEAKLKADKNLTDRQKANIRERVKNEKGYMFKQVKDLDVAMRAYKEGTEEEKAIYRPILKKRIWNLFDRDPKKYKKYRDLMKEDKQ